MKAHREHRNTGVRLPPSPPNKGGKEMDTEYDYDEELIRNWYDDDTLPCGCCACCGCSCDDDE